MIWKIWKKGKLNSEKKWKRRLNSEIIWQIQKKSKLNRKQKWKI